MLISPCVTSYGSGVFFAAPLNGEPVLVSVDRVLHNVSGVSEGHRSLRLRFVGEDASHPAGKEVW
jgi:hypothetical protein